MFRSVCCICQRTHHNVIFQQVATYLPPPLHPVLQKRIDQQKFPQHNIADDATNDGDAKRLQRKIARLQRRAYARFGAAAGIDPATLLPSKEEISAEAEAERRWWPTLQQLLESLRMKEEDLAEKKRTRDRKIEENMAKMPEWIKKFEENQLNLAEKEVNAELNRKTEIEMAQEKIGFDADPNNPILRDYLAGLKEQKRKEMKAKRRGLKKAKALSSV